MSGIVFKNLKTQRSDKKSGPARLYTDISLDFAINPNTKDLSPAIDEKAISNSVRNILNTRVSENFLVPAFGLSLEKYLFEQISELNGRLIGEEVVRAIVRYEPRVTISKVDVQVDPDEQQYTLTVVLYIPSIGQNISFNPIFTRDGLYYIGT